MDRDTLIAQVKSEYAKLADIESRESFNNLTGGGISPEAYYEALLGRVIERISAGEFDNCNSGLEVVEAVANNKFK